MNEEKYDKYQLKAIKSTKNTLLIAGAGSGKTTTIVGKINYLLNNGYTKNDILCISFTNASVNDLKKKLDNNVDIFTFHKLAINILKEYDNNFKLCDDNLLTQVIDEYILRLLDSKIKKKKFLKYVTNTNKFKKLAFRFINLYKSNYYDFKNIFIRINKIRNKNKRLTLLMNLINIVNIYKLYEIELKSSLELDFNDLILMATEVIKYTTYTNKYKYIIIDEFQDTSLIRLNLILEIYKKNNCKIFCVGDDFQSIYQFTGCNLNIFLNFKKYFENSSIMKLKRTYRNPQELINVAGNFIMKNKKQIKKKLISNIHISKPIKIVYLKDNLDELISRINTSYMILGRNNKDIYKYYSTNEIKNKNIIYKTIHTSKGLESDNIIIINLTNNIDSIPSKIPNDELIDILLNNKDDIYYEERRLFYVALTRTKNNVYLVINKNNISPFVKELIKNNKKYIEFITFK